MPKPSTFADDFLRLVATHYPGHVGARAVVRLRDATQVTRVGPAPEAAELTLAGLDDTDRDIVQACEEAGVTMSAEEIAAKAGYEVSGRFRERLSRLARQGHLKKMNPGYAHHEAPEE